jgi:phage gp36-like protein
MVTYLKQVDLQSSIRDHRLEHILDNTDANNTTNAFVLASSEAQSVVRDYLIKYDIDAELAKTLDDRHKSVVFYVKNICLYILYERIEDDDVPDRIVKNYNDTIETLRDISKGKLTIGLPLAQIDTDGDGTPDTYRTKFRWGSEPKRRYY